MVQIYKHKQLGTWTVLILLLAGALVIPIFLSMLSKGQLAIALVMLTGYCLVLAMFYAQTIEVSESKLSLWFGIGIVRKSYSVEEIQAVTEVRNPWYYLWGIKSIPDGWLYAIAPGSAVEIAFKSGKVIRLGTDEPKKLKQAIVATSGLDSAVKSDD